MKKQLVGVLVLVSLFFAVPAVAQETTDIAAAVNAVIEAVTAVRESTASSLVGFHQAAHELKRSLRDETAPVVVVVAGQNITAGLSKCLLLDCLAKRSSNRLGNLKLALDPGKQQYALTMNVSF